MSIGLMTGCITDDPEFVSSRGNEEGGVSLVEAPDLEVIDEDVLDELGLRLSECGQFYRFDETRTIKVQIFDRTRDDGRTHPLESYWTKWLQHEVLRDLNINVEYLTSPRDSEKEDLANLLASGAAPDIIKTYEYPAIVTFAESMNGILDLDPYVTGLAFLAPNLWELLGPELIYFNRNPRNGQIWAIEGIRHGQTRINTFVREDWLRQLGIPEPTTLAEFESMLFEFQTNAVALLGADADKIIPFTMGGSNVAWRSDHLLASFIPESITDKELYTRGFDDFMFTYTGIKEGVRKLNEWYLAGLMWQDFHLHSGRGDSTEDNMMKAGYVGSMIHNWEWPYRGDANGVQGMMRQSLNNESAGFIPVAPFQNDAGVYRKILPDNNDRKLCFPRTNQEPEASLLYLDYVSRLDVRSYLGSGEEGINFERVRNEAGEVFAVRTLDPTAELVRDNIFTSAPGIINQRTGNNTWTYAELIMNSPQNIDYLMTFNTNNEIFFESDEISAASRGFGFPEATPEVIGRAALLTSLDGRILPNVQVETITAEEGMATALGEKRNTTLINSIRAGAGEFDRIFDSGMADYLASGGQAIINERTMRWEELYGDVQNLSELD
jgi:putative aldouronate transport system substrate-binding protein